MGRFSPVTFLVSPTPSLHIKTEYSPRLAAFSVPPSSRAEGSLLFPPAQSVSLAVGVRGLPQRDAVAVGSFPVFRPVLTQALTPSPVRFLAPCSQAST